MSDSIRLAQSQLKEDRMRWRQTIRFTFAVLNAVITHGKHNDPELRPQGSE